MEDDGCKKIDALLGEVMKIGMIKFKLSSLNDSEKKQLASHALMGIDNLTQFVVKLLLSD